VTRSGKLPRTLHLFNDRHRERTQIFHHRPLADVIAELGTQHITHVLIEGGGHVLTEAFRAGLVNEVAFFIAPALMGTLPRALHELAAEVKLRHVSYQRIGPDLLCRGFI
jgi:diaminohydroxyphosphoribosylaminopyrimidine deaminase/5-amino-6-(5-phosphoribosylamino)uracil reductase